MLERDAADPARLRDGRKRALAALAYKAGGHRLVAAGIASALASAEAERVTRKSPAKGITRPLTPPRPRHTAHRQLGRTA